MSASKKTITTSIKSPAPAIKSTPVKPAAVVKKQATTVASVQTAKAVAVAKPAPSPVQAPKPVIKAAAAKPVLTTIAARVDVGFGNALFIRGEGPGLSWDKGLAMDCLGADLWQVVLSGTANAVTFKFLVNDLTWSAGPDFTAVGGTSVTLTPEF